MVVQLARVLASEDPVAAAEAVALSYTNDHDAGIARHRRGKGFVYVDARGHVVRDRATLARIRSLAIPPAWTHVWISPDPDGHVQATGRDAKGRKQYRYHARWREVRDETKYYRLAAFCRALPQIRAHVARDLGKPSLSREKVVATIVELMERAQLRVGNEEYAKQNHSYGATTLRNHHVKVRGNTLDLSYRGKGGVDRRVKLTDRRLAHIIRRLRDLPGQRLFQWVDGDGKIHPVTSNDVNAYLRAASGEHFTAKDYRTWAATLGAALLLCAIDHPGSERACKRCIKQVVARVAEQLGHTPAVCRASYIHPKLLEDFAAHRLRLPRRDDGPITVETLREIEPVVARYLGHARARLRA